MTRGGLHAKGPEWVMSKSGFLSRRGTTNCIVASSDIFRTKVPSRRWTAGTCLHKFLVSRDCCLRTSVGGDCPLANHYLRTLTTWHCSHSLAAAAAIDRYVLPAGPTAANPPYTAAAGEWDRRTDTALRVHTVYGMLCGQCQ